MTEREVENCVDRICCNDCPQKTDSCKEKCECWVYAKKCYLAGYEAGSFREKITGQ